MLISKKTTWQIWFFFFIKTSVSQRVTITTTTTTTTKSKIKKVDVIVAKYAKNLCRVPSKPLLGHQSADSFYSTQGHRNKFKSSMAKTGVWGFWLPAGIQGAESLGGGGVRVAKPREARAFLKMRLEFVQQVDGTMITKVLIKSIFLSWKKLAVAVPTALIGLHENYEVFSPSIAT